MIKKLLDKILNLLLPQKCIGCGKNEKIICEECLDLASKNEENIGIDNFAVFSYKNKAVKDAISLLKYKKAFSVSKTLGKYLYEAVLEEISQVKSMHQNLDDEKIIIIPVPLHQNRLKNRGYNQSELLAKEIIENNKEDFTLNIEVLKRIKETESQVSKMSRENRLNNLKGAFSVVKPEEVKNKIILLIDDVITTGSTVKECRETLIKAGAKKVLAIALAH